jgi:hypothetical protein
MRTFHFEGANITPMRLEMDEQERWFYPTLGHLNIKYQNNGFNPQPDTWSIVFEGMGDKVTRQLQRRAADRDEDVVHRRAVIAYIAWYPITAI